ncbi:MAG TPA: arginine deiminase family protein [Rhizomicrobium sp.]|jgi:dimethylargininase
MRVFDFDRAVVRSPGASVVDGLRTDKSGALDFAQIAREHGDYIAALHAAGLTVDVLAPLEAYPDSVFVEDPALVFPEGAIVLRPGAATRLGESAAIEAAVHNHFDRILRLEGDEYTDGGDVLVTPQSVFIGLSARTSRKGAQALRARLAELGRDATIVQTPMSVLHLKSASALLDDTTIVATEALAQSGIFARYDVVRIPAGEEPAANLVRVNDAVFVDDRFPRTIDLIARRGLGVVPLRIGEIARLDAGLSCMSLRWHSA